MRMHVYWCTLNSHIGSDRELYIHWGSNECLKDEVNLFVGHIVSSNNRKNADGDFLCLPNNHNPYPQRIKNAKLNLEDINDANGKNIPCAACVAKDRSIVFTFADTTTCPKNWFVEYVGLLAANPEYPGENICVDTDTSNALLKYAGKDLAVIATGSYNAYDPYKEQDAVSCVVCSI